MQVQKSFLQPAYGGQKLKMMKGRGRRRERGRRRGGVREIRRRGGRKRRKKRRKGRKTVFRKQEPYSLRA